MKKQHKWQRSVYIFLGCLFYTLNLSAQKEPTQLIAQQFTVADGLPSNCVYMTVADKKGFLWIGTNEGLSRFDGRKFYNYFEDANNRDAALQNSIVQNIVVFNDSLLLLATLSGVHVFNTLRFQFVNQLIKPEFIRAGNNANITAIQMLKHGSVIIASFDRVYFFDNKLNQDTLLNCKINGKTENFIGGLKYADADSNYLIFGCFKTSNRYAYLNVKDKKFMSTYAPLSCLNDSNFALSQFYYNETNHACYLSKFNSLIEVVQCPKKELLTTALVSEQKISSSCFYRIGQTLWMPALEGLFSLNLNTNYITHFTLLVNNVPLVKQSYISLHDDLFGNLWIASNNGLFLIKEIDRSTHLISFETNTTNNIEGLVIRNHNYFWHCWGAGIIVTDSNLKVTNRLNDARIKFVTHLAEVDSNLYVSSTTGTYKLSDTDGRLTTLPNLPDTLKSLGTTVYFKDRKQRKWLGFGAGNGLLLFDNNKKPVRFFSNHYPANHPDYLPIRNISYHVISNDGTLYAGYNQGGPLTCYNEKLQKFESVPLKSDNQTYNYIIVNGLFIDSNNNLWIVTHSHGVLCYQIKTKKCIRLCMPNYPIKNTCYSGTLINGTLYVTTAQHIVGIDVHSLKSFSINYSSGIKQGNYYTLSHNKNNGYNYLLASCYMTIQKINLTELATGTDIPKTYITQINNNGNLLSVQETGSFNNNNNQLNIAFTSACLNASSEFLFAYRLKPLMVDFVNINSLQNLAFYFLKPGHYTFEVRSSLDGSHWSAPATYTFNVLQPWWQTWWFYALILLTSIGITFLIFYIRQHNQQKLQKIRERISRDLHDEMGGTLSSINIISAAYQHKFDTEGRNVLLKINERSQKLLNSMHDIIWSIKPGNETLDDLTARMRSFSSSVLEAKNIHLTIQFPLNENHKTISLELKNHLYLIFKEAVNNLAKYSQCNHVNITLQQNKKQLILKITDDGIGFNVDEETKHHSGNGLSNMKHRAQAINGLLHIQSVPKQGTIVTLTVTLN
jgi:ligand-binding sensor domain-containing protein/two-component sensor histidine kinase